MSLVPTEVAVIREAAESVPLGESLWRIVKDFGGPQHRQRTRTRVAL